MNGDGTEAGEGDEMAHLPSPVPLEYDLESTPGAEPSGTPNPDANATLEKIEERLSRIESSLRTIERTNGDDSAMRELHSQLQEARAGLHWKILKPALLDLVKLFDSLDAPASAVDDQSAATADRLGEVRQDLLDILCRQGFEPFSVDGDRFDPKLQQPSRTLPSPSPQLAGTVVERLAPGFRSEDKVLRPERVVVYRAAAVATDTV